MRNTVIVINNCLEILSVIYGRVRKKEEQDAIMTAIRMLGEQIPGVPQRHYNWEDFSPNEQKETSKWFCPHCLNGLCESWNYCADCGKRLEW